MGSEKDRIDTLRSFPPRLVRLNKKITIRVQDMKLMLRIIVIGVEDLERSISLTLTF